jgi:hypothetical protein
VTAHELRQVRVPVPGPEASSRFADQVCALLNDASNREIHLQDLDRLFGNLLGRALKGQLTSKWREAHAPELGKEIEEQARALAAEAERS